MCIINIYIYAQGDIKSDKHCANRSISTIMALVYELVLKTLYAGQDCINRFNFYGTGTPVSVIPSYALLQGLGFVPSVTVFPTGTFARLLQDTLPSQVQFVQATARAILKENPTDFYDQPFTTGTHGTRTGVETMTPINAYGFRTNRVRVDISRGTKRFPGVAEPDAGDLGKFVPDAMVALNALAAKMGENVTYSVSPESLTFAPIVCKKVAYTTPSGKRAYKYFPTQAAQQANMAAGIQWQAYDNVRGQESRQYK